MVDNVASTYSQENAKEAFWRWLTKGGTQDPGVTGPSVAGAGASKGTPALTLGTTNAQGSASTFVATDATVLTFDATAPVTQAFGDTAAVGVATTAARRDHKHGMPAVGFTSIKRTAGTLTLNSTTWADVNTGLDLTLAAVTGDLIEVGLMGVWGNEAADAHIDVASIVSAAPVNYWGTAGSATDSGLVAWTGITGRFDPVGGTWVRALVSGDISGGNVVLRLRYRTSSGTNKTLLATADNPLMFYARNLLH